MVEMVLGAVNLTTVKSVHLSMDVKGDLTVDVTAAAISLSGEIITHKFEINLMGSAMKAFFKGEKVKLTADDRVLDYLAEEYL